MKHCAALLAVFAFLPVQITHAQNDGTVAGLVTAAETGAPLSGTDVTIIGTARSVTTGTDGRYVLTGVPPGTHRVRARLIGYALGEESVTVVAGQTVTVDVQLVAQVRARSRRSLATSAEPGPPCPFTGSLSCPNERRQCASEEPALGSLAA